MTQNAERFALTLLWLGITSLCASVVAAYAGIWP